MTHQGTLGHSCFSSRQEHTGHNKPMSLSTTTTQAEVTLLLTVGDDCTTLATPRDATTEAKQLCLNHHHHRHHYLSLNHKGRWGTTNDFATSFLHFFFLFSIALWDLANSRPVPSLMLSSHLFLCLPRLLPPFTVPCKMVLARSDERET